MSSTSDGETGPVEQSGWARLGHLLVQLSLVAGAAVALSDGAVSTGKKSAVVALTAVIFGWHWLMAYRWRYWELPIARFIGVMAVAAALWTPLLFLHAGFGVSVIGAYAVAACPFITRAAPSIAVLSAIILGVAAADGGLTVGETAGVLLTGSAIVVLHGLVGRIQRQNADQRVLIEELQSTRTQLAAREREAGVLSERERLARDIHDSLAQGFTSIIMLLEAADAQLDAEAVDVRARIDQARQAAREHLVEARRVVWSLRPGPLQRGALIGALEVLAATSFPAGQIDADFRVEGNPSPMPAEHEVILYRAAQEAFTNVAKHAGATRVVCTLTFLDDETMLDVNDNGCGFEPDRAAVGPGGGLGLIGLRERVATADGSLHIESTPSSGTNLTVAIPAGRIDERPSVTGSHTTP